MSRLSSDPVEPLRLAGLLDAASRADLPRLRAALDATWSDPEDYLRNLRQLAGRIAPTRSHVGHRYDLYGDLVTRHLDSSGAALVSPADLSGKTKCSFRELDEEASRLTTVWRSKGVEPGARVFVLTQPGHRFLIAVLTAFRLGLLPVILPRNPGSGFVLRRIRTAADSSYVVFDRETEQGLPGALPLQSLPSTPPAGALSDIQGGSYGYAPNEPALAVYGGFDAAPSVLTGESLFTRLATDAYLTLRPNPNTRVAAPGLEPARHAILPLLTLFSGATWVEISLDRLEQEPLPLDMVGISPELRDRVRTGRVVPRGWRRWFKDPSEPHDWSAWRVLSGVLERQGALGQNILYSSGLGGTLLFSPTIPQVDLQVLPAPGLPWMLEDPGNPGQATESLAGVLAGREGTPAVAATGRILISDTGEAFLYSGSLIGGRWATAYPSDEVVQVVQRHPLVDAAAVVILPRAGVLNAVTITVLTFVDPARDPDPVADLLGKTLERAIAKDLGRTHVPDRFMVCPLTPRWVEPGVIDLDWCRYQLQTGGLRARSKNEIYRLTSLLRRWGAQRAASENGG